MGIEIIATNKIERSNSNVFFSVSKLPIGWVIESIKFDVKSIVPLVYGQPKVESFNLVDVRDNEHTLIGDVRMLKLSEVTGDVRIRNVNETFADTDLNNINLDKIIGFSFESNDIAFINRFYGADIVSKEKVEGNTIFARFRFKFCPRFPFC